MKGVFNLRPPQPKYSCTWDAGLATKYLESLPANNDLAFSVLTKRCAMLLALSASKLRDNVTFGLWTTDLRSVSLKEFLAFQLAALTKTRTATKSTEFFFLSFPHNKKLCPVTCLDSSVERTTTWREVGNGPQPLFSAIQARHKSVSSATIGRWLKDKMKHAGWC